MFSRYFLSSHLVIFSSYVHFLDTFVLHLSVRVITLLVFATAAHILRFLSIPMIFNVIHFYFIFRKKIRTHSHVLQNITFLLRHRNYFRCVREHNSTQKKEKRTRASCSTWLVSEQTWPPIKKSNPYPYLGRNYKVCRWKGYRTRFQKNNWLSTNKGTSVHNVWRVVRARSGSGPLRISYFNKPTFRYGERIPVQKGQIHFL